MSSSLGAGNREPEKEVYGEQTGRISPSHHDNGEMNKKLIHKDFFNSFQGQSYFILLLMCTLSIFIPSTLLSIVLPINICLFFHVWYPTSTATFHSHYFDSDDFNDKDIGLPR